MKTKVNNMTETEILMKIRENYLILESHSSKMKECEDRLRKLHIVYSNKYSQVVAEINTLKQEFTKHYDSFTQIMKVNEMYSKMIV